jgi:hypothetical protein
LKKKRENATKFIKKRKRKKKNNGKDNGQEISCFKEDIIELNFKREKISSKC